MLPGLSSFVVNPFCYQTSKSLPSLCLLQYFNRQASKRNNLEKERVANVSLGVVEVHVTYTKRTRSVRPWILQLLLFFYFYFFIFLATKIFLMATILKLKVAKRRLFEKVSLERWYREGDMPHMGLSDLFAYHLALRCKSCKNKNKTCSRQLLNLVLAGLISWSMISLSYTAIVIHPLSSHRADIVEMLYKQFKVLGYV